jgi:tetratricopeptide (TPR) repeat protein
VRYPEPGFDAVFAQNVLVQAVDVNNQSAELFFSLGLVGHKTGQFDYAIPMYEKAIELLAAQSSGVDGVYFDAVSSLATVLHEQGRLVEAEAFYRVAEQLSPNNVILLANYATLLAGLHRWEEGFQLAKRAIKVDPTSSVAQSAYDQFVLTLSE